MNEEGARLSAVGAQRLDPFSCPSVVNWLSTALMCPGVPHLVEGNEQLFIGQMAKMHC